MRATNQQQQKYKLIVSISHMRVSGEKWAVGVPINTIFFTVEKYQFYSHLICIEFTACDKINLVFTSKK